MRRRSRGSLFIEEILLIAVSIAVLIALVTLVSGLVGNVTNSVLGMQESVSGAINSFIRDINQVVSNAFNINAT